MSDKADCMVTNPSRYELEQQLNELARKYQGMETKEVFRELLRIAGKLGELVKKEKRAAYNNASALNMIEDDTDQLACESVYDERDERVQSERVAQCKKVSPFAVVDLEKYRTKKVQEHVIDGLRKTPGVTIVGPYVICYDDDKGIQVALLEDAGIRTLFQHKVL